MDDHYYYSVFRKTIVQLANLFNNIKVAKYESDGSISKFIQVPLKFATKDKMYQSVEDNKRTRPLPMMALSMYGITHDPMRIAAKGQYVISSRDVEAGTINSYLIPVPYNLDFQMTIATKYKIEIDQILEQILAYFNPFVYVRIRLDEISPTTYFDVKVLFTSATPELQTDLTEQEMRIESWTLYFTVYTYLFTPASSGVAGVAPGPAGGLVKSIITKFYGSEEAWEHQGQETMFTSGGSGSYEAEALLLKAIGYDDEGDIEVVERIYSGEDYDR